MQNIPWVHVFWRWDQQEPSRFTITHVIVCVRKLDTSSSCSGKREDLRGNGKNTLFVWPQSAVGWRQLGSESGFWVTGGSICGTQPRKLAPHGSPPCLLWSPATVSILSAFLRSNSVMKKWWRPRDLAVTLSACADWMYLLPSGSGVPVWVRSGGNGVL